MLIKSDRRVLDNMFNTYEEGTFFYMGHGKVYLFNPSWNGGFEGILCEWIFPKTEIFMNI